MSAIWTPHLTVAAVIERNGRFLLVEEAPDGRTVINQPAGHVEEMETIIDAIRREMLEETGRSFTPEAISGLYRWRSPRNDVTYLRVVFCGPCSEPLDDLVLDADIIATHWFTSDELRQQEAQLRSPMVLRCIEDYLQGQRYPLDLIADLNPPTIAP